MYYQINGMLLNQVKLKLLCQKSHRVFWVLVGGFFFFLGSGSLVLASPSLFLRNLSLRSAETAARLTAPVTTVTELGND